MEWDNIISRTIWILIQPGNFFFLMLLLGLFLNIYNQKKNIFLKIGRYLVITSITIMSLVGFTNLSSWILWPLESRMDAFRNKTDLSSYSGIIILSGSEDPLLTNATNQATFGDSSERLIQTAALARKYTTLPIIHSGGVRPVPSGFSENDVARIFFKEAGINLSRVRFETDSYNTHSNAIGSKALIKVGECNKWLLVTSAFHMPRSVGTFQQAGINIQPYPVDYRTSLKYDGFFRLSFSENFQRFDLAIHEYIGLLAYYITGRSNKIFPDNN